MSELGRHINQAHIGIVPIPCPLKGCLYTFITNNLPTFLSHLDNFHRNHLSHDLSLIDNLKPLANPRQHALPNNPPQLPQLTTAAAAGYPHPVIPRKCRNLTRTLSAISAAGSSMQSLSSSPRKRTRLSTRVFDPPSAPVPGPSSAPAPASDSDGDDWDDTSVTKHFDDLPHSTTAWNAPNLLVQRAKGPRWDKQRALGGDVVIQSTRKFPPTKRVQLSMPPLYKGRANPTYKVQPELMTTFTAMMERHKRLEDGGLFNADVETWVTREGAEV
ncbi:hypothetical protein PENSPDRAFT_231165 [Peniophora sp. CONT]|nr:hypothetical protein PENSPDRAFT_231165 [Peniophora sp. CONT]